MTPKTGFISQEQAQSEVKRKEVFADRLNEFTVITGGFMRLISVSETIFDDGELYKKFPDVKPTKDDRVFVYQNGNLYGKGPDGKLHLVSWDETKMFDIEKDGKCYGIAPDGHRCECKSLFDKFYATDANNQRYVFDCCKPLYGEANMNIKVDLKEEDKEEIKKKYKNGDIVQSNLCILLYDTNPMYGKDITLVCVDDKLNATDSKGLFDMCKSVLKMTVLKENKEWENGEAITDILLKSKVLPDTADELVAIALFGRLSREIHKGNAMRMVENKDENIWTIANMIAAYTGDVEVLLEAIECDKWATWQLKKALESAWTISLNGNANKEDEKAVEDIKEQIKCLQTEISQLENHQDSIAIAFRDARRRYKNARKKAQKAQKEADENPNNSVKQDECQNALEACRTALEACRTAREAFEKAVREYDYAEAKRIDDICAKKNEIHDLWDQVVHVMCKRVTIKEIDFKRFGITPGRIMGAFIKRVEQICPNIKSYSRPSNIRIPAMSTNVHAMEAEFNEIVVKDENGKVVCDENGVEISSLVMQNVATLDNAGMLNQLMLLGDTTLLQIARDVVSESDAVKKAGKNDIMDYISEKGIPLVINVDTQLDKESRDMINKMAKCVEENPDSLSSKDKALITRVQTNTATRKGQYNYELSTAYGIFKLGFVDNNGIHYTYLDTSASQFRMGKSAFIVDPDNEGWLLSAKIMCRLVNVSPKIVRRTIFIGRKKSKTNDEIANELFRIIQDICDGLRGNNGYEIKIPKGLSRFGLSASTTLDYDSKCHPSYNASKIVQFFRRYLRKSRILIVNNDGKKLKTVVRNAEIANVQELDDKDKRQGVTHTCVINKTEDEITIEQIMNDGGGLVDVSVAVAFSLFKREISEKEATFFRDNWMESNQYQYSLEELNAAASNGDKIAIELKRIIKKAIHTMQCRAPGGDTNGFGMKFVGVMYSIRGDKKLGQLNKAYNHCHMIIPASCIKIFKDDGSAIKCDKYGKYIMDFNMLKVHVCNVNKHNNLETHNRKMTAQYFNMLNIDGEKILDMANQYMDKMCEALKVIDKPDSDEELVKSLIELNAFGNEREFNVFNRALEFAKANQMMIRDERFLDYLREQVADELLDAATGKFPVKGDYLYAVCDPYASINAWFAEDFKNAKPEIEPYKTLLDYAKDKVFKDTKKEIIRNKKNAAKNNRKAALGQMTIEQVIAEARDVANTIPEKTKDSNDAYYKHTLFDVADSIEQQQKDQEPEEEIKKSVAELIDVLADKVATDTGKDKNVQDEATAEAEKARDNLKDVYYVNGYSGLIAVFRSPASAQYQAQRGMAINVEAYWYLSDCLVFSCEGNWRRLAGADFDGDKFLVILNINETNRIIIEGVTMCDEIIADPEEIGKVIRDYEKKHGGNSSNVMGALTVENICRVLAIAVRKSGIGQIAKWAAADLNMANHLREAHRIASTNNCEFITFVVPSIEGYDWVSSTKEDSEEMRERNALNAEMVKFMSENHSKEEFITTLDPYKIKKGFEGWVIKYVTDSDGITHKTLFVEGYIERYQDKYGDIICKTQKDDQGCALYCGLYGKHGLDEVETLAAFYLERNKHNSVAGDMEIDATNNGWHSYFHEWNSQMGWNELSIDMRKNKDMNLVKVMSAYMNIGVLGNLFTGIMSRWGDVMGLISPDKAVDMSTYMCMILDKEQIDNIIRHRNALMSIKCEYDENRKKAMDIWEVNQDDDELEQNLDNIEYETQQNLISFTRTDTCRLTSQALAIACYLMGKGGAFSFLFAEDLRELLKDDPEAMGIEKLPKYFNKDKDQVKIKTYCGRNWLTIARADKSEILLNALKIKSPTKNKDGSIKRTWHVYTADDKQSYVYYERKADNNTAPNKRQLPALVKGIDDNVLELLTEKSNIDITLADSVVERIRSRKSTNAPMKIDDFEIKKNTSYVRVTMNKKGNINVHFCLKDKNGENSLYYIGKKIEIKVRNGAKFVGVLLNAYLLNHDIVLDMRNARLTENSIVDAKIMGVFNMRTSR